MKLTQSADSMFASRAKLGYALPTRTIIAIATSGVFACLLPIVAAEESVPTVDTAASVSAEVPVEPSPPTTRRTVEHDGQTFELANSTSAKNVETDEYVVSGEKIADWSQIVTVQRLTLAKPTPADEFLAYFQKKLEAENGATLEILRQSKVATVFAVRFPKSEHNDEQVMICLAFVDDAQPTLLNIVQYALKPARVSANLAEMRIKSWRDKFLVQAKAMAKE